MVDAYRRFDRAFGNISHTICYAVKANSNLSILRLLADLGSGFDIVSAGELHRLRSIGVAGKRAVFSGVGKTREEIREALRAEILLFNVESEAELDVLAAEAARFRRRASAALRVNPDVDAGGHAHISTGHHRHKFGSTGKTPDGCISIGRVRAGSPGRASACTSARESGSLQIALKLIF
jgi:diaminopimelate decarboxylase